jgi:hypothetical protein
MQYGKDHFRLSNSYDLARFLRENGQEATALSVEAAIYRAKNIARQNYFKNRKVLQPDWKDWNEQREEITDDMLRALD